MSKKAQKTTYKGVEYPSLTAAAAALSADVGISVPAARERLIRGVTEARNYRKATVYDGVTYPTESKAATAMAEALGITYSGAVTRLRKGDHAITNRIKFTLDGKEYPSLRAAAFAYADKHNVSFSTARRRIEDIRSEQWVKEAA